MDALNCRLDAVNCKRVNLGGGQAASYLQRLLQLKYPANQTAITLSRMEELLHQHSYVALDYQQGKTHTFITYIQFIVLQDRTEEHFTWSFGDH